MATLGIFGFSSVSHKVVLQHSLSPHSCSAFSRRTVERRTATFQKEQHFRRNAVHQKENFGWPNVPPSSLKRRMFYGVEDFLALQLPWEKEVVMITFHSKESRRHRLLCRCIAKSEVGGFPLDETNQRALVYRVSKASFDGCSLCDASLRRNSGHLKLRTRLQAVNADAQGVSGTLQNIREAGHLAVSLGLFLVMDKALKHAFTAAAIRFPSALFGMFSIFSLLLLLDSIKPAAASSVVVFFEPATTFIQRWLPLFYVPSLVVLPLAVQGIPAASAAKIGAIMGGGWVASLCVAGYTAVAVRKMVRTEMQPAEAMPKAAPFSRKELWSWTAVMLLSFAFAVISPTALGTVPSTTLPFLLAATVVGYIFGSGLPSGAKKVLHPIITCAIAADLAAFAFGAFTQTGFFPALGAYLTKKAGNPGAGDILMGFLGSVILSFAFSMFRQRKLVKRHAAEIFSAVVASSVFSLYSTAAVGHLVGLDPSFTIAIVPRCITVALALSIANLFEVTNTSLTAAVVVLTGLVGANFAQTLMDRLGLKDPIARGMATASSAHGLGTAALSAKEPEALPFCAIAYALTGIFCSVLCSIPTVRHSLLLLAGSPLV